MSPGEAAVRLLRHRFGTDRPHADGAGLEDLARFQQDAVPRLERALARYGGALLADAVGLGKTHVAAAVVRRFVRAGGAAAVIVPTTLVRQWRRALRHTPSSSVLTHAAMSRGGIGRAARASLIVVDEAHGFRNPHTRRYRALAHLTCDRPVLLITATPVNNSLWDLYWLVRLFAADDAFLDAGVPDLLSCVREAIRTGRYSGIGSVVAEVAVRRARVDVRDLRHELRDVPIRFPEREPPREIRYAVPAVLQRSLLDCIESLTLVPWARFGPPGCALLLRLVLLKRLESSHAAFLSTLTRLCGMLRSFRDAIGAGRLLTPAEHRARILSDADQLVLEELVLRPLPRHLDAAALVSAVAADLRRVERVIADLRSLPTDPKVERLRQLVAEELAPRPVIIFTEFRETALHLWRALTPMLPAALIHGGGAFLGRSRATRRAVVERFAPHSNGVPPPPPRERVQVLIATDVLAEGLNLQDAADVISYDLPWNPIRLVQRIGRVDRLGSRHERVRCHYFTPDTQLEAMLRLVRRIESKLDAIRGAIGEDGAVLAGGETHAPGTAELQPRPSHTDRLFAVDERLRRALAAHEDRVSPPLRGLPLGSTATGPTRGAGDPAALQLCAPNGSPLQVEVWRPQSARFAEVRAVLFFEHRGRQRAVCIGARRTFEDEELAGELLLGLLQEAGPDGAGGFPAPRPPGQGGSAPFASWADRARRLLLRPPAAVPRTSAGIRALRQRLLRGLQQRAGGPTPEECARVERLADLLASPLPVHRQLAAQAVAAARPAVRFERLLAQLEEALGDRPAPAAPRAPATVPPPRLLCTFVLVPRPGGTCHTSSGTG